MEDANELIDLARETGLIEAQFRRELPNATKCLSHADVERSHFGKDEKVVFKMDNIYGMIILLSLGLCVSTLIAMVELIAYKAGNRREDQNGVIVI